MLRPAVIGFVTATLTTVAWAAQSNAPSAPPPFPVASEAELIRRTQQLLLEIGQYDGPVDGKMSNETVAAIKHFQTLRGLEPNGKTDRLLVNMLEDAKKP